MGALTGISLSQNGLQIEKDIAETLEHIFDQAGLDEIVVERQRQLTLTLFTTMREKGSEASPITPDILISFSPNHAIPELDNIENLDRWFPDSQIQIPIAAIAVKTRRNFSIKAITEKPAEPQDDTKDSLPFEVSQNLLIEDENISDEVDITDEHVETIHQGDELEDTPLITELTSLAEAYTERSRQGDISYSDLVDTFDPEVFHFNEVLSAYRNDRVQMLVILLSVFFEGYIKELRTKTMTELQQNEDAGAFYSKWEFKDSLDACRFFGTLDDRDYQVIDRIRDERNSYAHNIEGYHENHSSTIVEEGVLERGIQLYEELIGVKKSMLDE